MQAEHNLLPEDYLRMSITELLNLLSRQVEVGPAGKQPKKATVNERMKAELASNMESVSGWTAKQWAEHLKCGQTTVKDTETWKTLVILREKSKAEKQMKRNRR